MAAANANWQRLTFCDRGGADLNSAEKGWNALHQAVRERRPNIGLAPRPDSDGAMTNNVISKMLAYGAKVNARMTKNEKKDGQQPPESLVPPPFLAAKNTDTEVMKARRLR